MRDIGQILSEIKPTANLSTKMQNDWTEVMGWYLGLKKILDDSLASLGSISREIRLADLESVSLKIISYFHARNGMGAPSVVPFYRFSENVVPALRRLDRLLVRGAQISSFSTADEQEIVRFRRQIDACALLIRGDIKTIGDMCFVLREKWNELRRMYLTMPIPSEHRPALSDVHRFRLADGQEEEVERDYLGHWRVNGHAGSGKTLVLVHRALRLALSPKAPKVLVLTQNQDFAQNLMLAMVDLHGGALPPNLSVKSFYYLALDMLPSEERVKARLSDTRSGERIGARRGDANHSWTDFFESQRDKGFPWAPVAELLRSLRSRSTSDGGRIDAELYIQQECSYIRTSYRSERDYVDSPRTGRQIRLSKKQMMVCWSVSRAWSEWLRCGGLQDPEGAIAMALTLGEPPSFDHILLDEAQDATGMEMELIQRIAPKDRSAKNRVFLAGDWTQRSRISAYQRVLNFQGRSVVLTQSYRNTQEILRVAKFFAEKHCPADTEWERVQPQDSPFRGSMPDVVRVPRSAHVEFIVRLVSERRSASVAVITESHDLRDRLLHCFRSDGVSVMELVVNDQLDNVRGRSESARVCVSSMEAAKGFEFDTVVLADISSGILPPAGTDREEVGSAASLFYSALTRARTELIITYVGCPSVFLASLVDGSMPIVRHSERGLIEPLLSSVESALCEGMRVRPD
jgi:hypothetical protein